MRDNWEKLKLGKMVSIQSGDSPSLYILTEQGEVPYVKVEDLNNCAKYQFKSRNYTQLSLKKTIPVGAVIFPKRGASIMTNKVRLSKVPLYMDSNMMAIKANENILNDEYLYYSITYEKLYKIADTSTIPQINNKHINPYQILLPPLAEQERIAEILGCWDIGIQRLGNLILAKKKLKKALMQQLLTGKKRFKKFKEQKWEFYKASELFRSFSKKNNDGEDLLSATQDRGVIPRSLLEGRVMSPEGSIGGYKLVESGDFVISLRSFQGGLEYSEYRGVISPAYIVLKSNMKIDDYFYKHYFKSYQFIGHLAVAVIGIRDGKQISYSDFGFLKLPYPPLAEQQKIASVLNAADKEIELLNKRLESLKQQKKGLMQKLLTGKIRVKI